jgi:hypothetical protein
MLLVCHLSAYLMESHEGQRKFLVDKKVCEDAAASQSAVLARPGLPSDLLLQPLYSSVRCFDSPSASEVPSA